MGGWMEEEKAKAHTLDASPSVCSIHPIIQPSNHPLQYLPYSRVNSVMAFTFSTLESSCMMAPASMM